MREIGNLPDQDQANNFVDYLMSRGIASQIRTNDSQLSIWIRNEDDLPAAREAIAEFRADPTDEMFTSGAKAIQRIRLQEEIAKHNSEQPVRIPHRPLRERAPLLSTLFGLSLFVFLIAYPTMGFSSAPRTTRLNEANIERSLLICDASRLNDPNWSPAKDGLVDVKRGQLWRLVTPAFVHFGIAHILFNLYVLYMWGVAIEDRHGSAFMLFLFLATAAPGNLAEFLVSQQVYIGGMSGFAYGLFGYIWIRMYVAPEDRLEHHPQTILLVLALLVMGFLGVLDSMLGKNQTMANWVHLIGMLAGMLIAYLQFLVRPVANGVQTADPSSPSR